MTAFKPATVTYEVIGVVRSPHTGLEGMPLQSVAAPEARGQIELEPGYQAALRDLDGFSHVWIVSHLHRSTPSADPLVMPFLDTVERGLFATRSPRHPNPIGLSVVRLLSIEGATLHVIGLDLLDGTPVLDLKPYVPLFDSIDAERTGWLTHRAGAVHSVRADQRFDAAPTQTDDEEVARNELARERPSVRDVMYSKPKTLPHDATVGDVRALFRNRRVRLALLEHHGVCTGTLTSADIPAASLDEDAAGWLAQPPQTIDVGASLVEAHDRLGRTAAARLVVIDDRGRLRGLLCHNHAGDGFCNQKSPCGRTAPAAPKTRWTIIRTSGPDEHRSGMLVAPEGKSLNVGDVLNLPPDEQRWLVIEVTDDPHHACAGIAMVDELASPPRF